MKKSNLWLGLSSIIVIYGLTIFLKGELRGSLSTSPVLVVNNSENETTGSQKNIPIHVDVNYNSQILNLTLPNKAFQEIAKSKAESKLDLSKSPKVEQKNRQTSKQYQAYLLALNSVPLPRGRLVIQVNSEAGVALANRDREHRREAKRRPIRSFAPNVLRQPTASSQIAMESSVAREENTSTLVPCQDLILG